MSKSLILISCLFLTSSYAQVQEGQRYFSRHCKACHNLGSHIATTKTQKEWLAYLEDDADKLKHFHLSSEEAKESWGYFKGRYPKDEFIHLRDFLLEFSSDSGTLDVCG